jgi:hypothetical protein
MRALRTALLPFLLAGCTNGYTIDHLRPKTFLVAPQLARYGLDPDQSQCVGARLSKELTVRQMRQLAEMVREGRQGVEPGRLTPFDLSWYASQVKDPKIPAALNEAIEGCGLSIARPMVAPTPTAPALPEIPAPDQAPENGPRNYQPSENLWAAFEAFEKGDFASAARLSKLAAEQGDSGAQQFLGGLYSFGQGVPKSPAEAVKYYAMAAEHGWSEAMANLGKAYETGEGVLRDSVQALKWYLLASARPTEDPAMVERSVRNVSGTLTQDQLQQAAAMAKDWEQSHRQ